MSGTTADRAELVDDLRGPNPNPPAQSDRLPVANRHTVFAELRGMTVGRRGKIAGIVVLFLLSAGATLVLPLTIGWIVDTVGSSNGVPRIFWWQLAALAGAAVLGGIVEFAGIVTLTRVIETMLAELRDRYVESALGLPPQVVERVGIGDVVSRATTDIRRISDDLPGVIPAIASAIFTLVLAVGGTALIDWRFTIAFLLAIPLYALALRWYLPAVPPVYAAEAAAESARSESILTTITALPTVLAFRGEQERIERVRTSTWEVGRWAMRARIMQNRFFGRINFAEAVGMILILGCGFLLAAETSVSLGQITAASLLFLQITGPIYTVIFMMDDVQSAFASLGRVIGVTTFTPPVHTSPVQTLPVQTLPVQTLPTSPQATSARSAGLDDPVAADPPGRDAVVEVHNVGFGYRREHPVLCEVTLEVGRTEHLAIVGSTGSGKTTLAQLISGTRTPDDGSISFAVPIDRIVYLNQDSYIFAATVRDNLRLAAPHADDEQLHQALARVGADAIVAGLPEGLDTPVGHEGHRLSGAHAQLISLARLVLADPALAILDEATAETDSQNSTQLDEAAARAIDGRAAIVIAHRLSQAKACDRIIVLERGEIIEQGTHTDLLARGGRYAGLWAAYSRTDNPD